MNRASGDKEFECRAINDYLAADTDEIDLIKGEIYTILQVNHYLDLYIAS